MPLERRHSSLVPALLLCALTSGCAPDERAYRGAGLQVAPLAVTDQAGVYRSALAGAFRLDDPTLIVLLDTMFLPRSSGLVGGDTMPASLVTTLRQSGLVKGTCQLPVRKGRVPLICRAERPGYAVRFSQPFAVAPDTVQVHVAVEQYAIPSGPMAERMRFERAYYVARQGAGWRAVREARLSQP